MLTTAPPAGEVRAKPVAAQTVLAWVQTFYAAAPAAAAAPVSPGAADQQALTRRLQDFETSQLNDIRRHLSDEEMRLSALSNVLRVAPVPAERPVARIAEQDLAELRQRWIPALEARLADLANG